MEWRSGIEYRHVCLGENKVQPKTLTTRTGLEIGVLDQSSSHKWLSCMLSMASTGRRQDDIDHRLQHAAAFLVNK